MVAPAAGAGAGAGNRAVAGLLGRLRAPLWTILRAMSKPRPWQRSHDPSDTSDAAPAGTTVATEVPPVAPAPPDTVDRVEDEEERPFRLRDLTPLLLLRAAHPRQALVTALGLAGAAALAGRPSREILLVLATVVVGQAILGWHNDLVDRTRDQRHHSAGKPVADGRLDPGTVWFVLALAVLVVVPLSVANGLYAAGAYLGSLLIGLVGNWTWLRKGLLSWLPWALSFALYPAFLSYGGFGGKDNGDPPQILVTVLFALLGVGVHLLRALWGLVADNAEGWTYLPLRLGLRLGATKLLLLASVYTAAVVVALAFAGTYVGLSR